MLLEPEDVEKFFKLHRALMFFVNQRLTVIPDKIATPEEFSSLSPEVRLKVRNAFLSHTGLIQLFLDENPARLSDAELAIIHSWRHLVTGKFYVFRELKKYTVGMVIELESGFVFAMKMVESTPTVNDLARLLADAMQRPLVEIGRHRPRSIRLRDNPEWSELVPHLEELRIKVIFTGDLAIWDDAAADYQSPVKTLWLNLRNRLSTE